MGFFNDVKNGFVDRLGETLEDAAWTIAAPVAAIFDLAAAPFSEEATVGGALTTGLQRGTQLLFGDENDPNKKDDNEDNLINEGLGKGLDGLEWLYDQAIAPGASTVSVMGQRFLADMKGIEDGYSPWDVGSAFSAADENRSSPGREAAYMWFGLFGDERGLTDEGQKILNAEDRKFDVLSGAIDLGSRVILDPLIVVGKAGKVLRQTQVLRGVKSPGEIPKLLSEGDGIFAGFGTRHQKAMEFIAAPTRDGASRSAGEIYFANKGLQDANDGWLIAEAMENTVTSMRKTGASTEDIVAQVALVSRAGMGDADALKQITDTASEAKDALASFHSRFDELKKAQDWSLRKTERGPQWVSPYTPPVVDAGRDAATAVATRFNLVDEVMSRGDDFYASPEFTGLVDARLKAVKSQLDAAEQEAARQAKLAQLFDPTDGVAGQLADRPLLAALKGGSTKGMERRARRERQEPAKLDVVFQSSVWNKGVKYLAPHVYLGAKAVRQFRTTSAPRVVQFHDPRAAQGVNDFLKHSAVDADTRETIVSEMASATAEGAKRVATEKAIKAAMDSMVDKYKALNPRFDDDAAEIVKGKLAQEMDWERNRLAIQLQKFSAHKKADGKTEGDIVIGEEDGLAHYHALLETQLQNQMILPDLRAFEKILHRHSNGMTDMAAWARGDRLPDQNRIKEIAARVFDAKYVPSEKIAKSAENLNQAQWKSQQFMVSALQGFTRAWKYAALLRPAYPMRVLVDSDLRMLSQVGFPAFMMHTAPRAFGFATFGGATRAKQMFAMKADDDMRRSLANDIEKFEDTMRAASDEPFDEDPTYVDLLARKAEVDRKLELGKTRKGRRQAYGTFGDAGQRDIKTRAGTFKGAFADDYGRTQRWKASSQTSAALMGDSEKISMRGLLSESWTTLTYQDANHMESWLHAVNAQLLQSTLGKKALEFQMKHGDNRDEAIRELTHWAKSSTEGRELMGRLMWTAADKTEHAREVVGYINHYLPSRALREKALSDKRIGRADFEGAFPDPTMRPAVHGQSIAMAVGRGSLAGKALNEWFSRTMAWLADAPEDQLARHPMYAAVYEQEVKRRAEYLLADPSVETLSGAEIHEQIQKHAHKKAQQAIKNYMFDVASHSDLSHAMRFVSPFIAAWEDTVRKWSRIVIEKPDILGKAYLGWNAPNDLGLVVDKDGNPVDKDDFNDETYMLVRWPSWVPKVGGKAIGRPGLPFVETGILKGDGTEFRIPKQVVNIVLQGGLQPGFGPLVALPVGKLQVANPDLNTMARFINPYGPPEGVWDAIAPSTLKRITELTNEQSRAHIYDTERMFMQMQTEYRIDPEKFGMKAPTWEEAAQRANGIGMLKILNNFVNPFPAIFDSPYKLYIDSYRNLKRAEIEDDHERGWADDQFIQKYGESFFPLVQSMSKNNAGLGASAEAVDAAKRYKSEISKYGMEAGEPNSALIRLIVGPDGEGVFNESAHRWQQTREISPGSGLTYRSIANSQEAAADADASLGWYKYRQFMNTINAMANEQGLRTFSESEELVATKAEFVQNLKDEIPAWEVDWDKADYEKFSRDIVKLDEVSHSSKFGEMRTDIKGVREYIALRKALQEELAEFGISEGSQDAAPFKQEFTDAVMDLVSQNTQFSEWAFNGFLERDPLLADILTADAAQSVNASGTSEWGF